MYVATKGGEKAIEAAHRWLAEQRRGDATEADLTLQQIEQQLGRAVDRAMCEGSLYDRELAALAVKQAQGDLIEAAFLLRSFRSTLPRLAYSLPLDSSAMRVRRRISATFKDLPGGQVLGPTPDYSHRLLDFSLATPKGAAPPAERGDPETMASMPSATGMVERAGPIGSAAPGRDGGAPGDLTRDALDFPADRGVRLQNLARGDEGFLLSLAYSTQRGFGSSHPFVGELRVGEIAIQVEPEELGFPIEIGSILLTECQMVNQFKGSATEPPQFTRGYGLTFGHNERKAMSMALVDRALRGRELGEESQAPARDEEFVLYHSDNVQATGFVEHLKLPHHVDFQAELVQLRALRDQAKESAE